LLYSEPGMGTTFKIYLPIVAAQAAPAAQPDRRSSLDGHETILLVEDTDIVRALVVAVLEPFGYTVLQAGSGPEAIELADGFADPIDLLMTDVVMPGMNGREVAEALVARRPGLKVLFTSGYPADTVIRHGIAEARAAFIEKPYLPDDLARKIREVLASGPGE
jgi:CheY-like chemotaxis protein